MNATSGRLGWVLASVALFYGLSLAYGLMRFGAAETDTLYRLFLLLLIPTLIALLARPLGRWTQPRLIPIPILGLVILGQVAIRPELTGRGWTHLGVGWLALYLTLWLVIQRGPWVRFLVLTLIVLGGIEALYGLMQAVGGVDYIGSYFRGRGSQATGTLINRNHFAFSLTLILPLALGALYTRYERRREARESLTESWAQNWIVLLSCSFMGVGVLLSQSRGGTISLVATLLFVALLLTLRRRSGRREVSSAIAWILVATVLGLTAAIGIEALLERFGQLDRDLSRIQVYQDTLRLIGDHMLFGVGPGMYIWGFRPYQSTDSSLLYDHAHNDYLESAAEWGVMMAMVVWAFVFWRFLRASRLFLTSRSTRRQGLALGCAAAIFSVLLHSLVDFSLQLPALLMLFATVLALAWSLDLNGSRPSIIAVGDVAEGGAREATPVGGTVLRVLLVVAVLAAGWSVLRHLRALDAAVPANGVAGLQRATEIDPSSSDPKYLLGLAYRDLPGFGSTALAVEYLSSAARLNPFHWRYRTELGRAQELVGDLDRAQESLIEAVRLNPVSGAYRWRLANLLLRRGKVDAAIREIGRALELDPRLRLAALALLVKTGVDFAAIESIWPLDRDSRLTLLRAVSAGSVIDEPPSVEALEAQWNHLSGGDDALTVAEARSYVSYLLKRGETDLAITRWAEVAAANGYQDRVFESRENLIWNGDFSRELLGAPLGWQVRQANGYVADLGAGEGRSNTAALRVAFDGSENLSLSGIGLQAVVEPGARYSLSYSVRSEAISTDKGLFVEVVPASGGGALYSGPEIIGSTDWQTESDTLKIPFDTTLVQLRLRRDRSEQIDSRIRGTVWLDDFRLQRAE